MEKLKRDFENSVNRHTGTSTRRPQSRNEQEAQKVDMVSYSSKPNATRLPTPKTNKANRQSISCRIAKIRAESERQAADIRREDAEKKTFTR